MKRIDVSKKGDRWVGMSGGQQVSQGKTKEQTVKNTAREAKADPQAVTVKIHKIEGNKIQEERTYPGSADPRNSKG